MSCLGASPFITALSIEDIMTLFLMSKEAKAGWKTSFMIKELMVGVMMNQSINQCIILSINRVFDNVW